MYELTFAHRESREQCMVPLISGKKSQSGPRFEPKTCFRFTVFAPNETLEFWSADPSDPEEPAKVVDLGRNERQEQARSGIAVVDQGMMFDLTWCYSRVAGKTMLRRDVHCLGLPFVIERMPKPDWWESRDNGAI